MNAVSRAINSRAINLPVLNILPLTRQAVVLIVMVASLLLSAFGIIYLKDLNRRLFIQAEHIKQQQIMASEAWSRLLLERGTLVAQPRIQKIAEEKLGMHIPSRQEIQLVSRSGD